MSLRPERAKDTRPEDDAREQLSHHGRLLDPLHEFPEQPPQHDEQHHLSEEKDHGVVAVSRRCCYQ